MAQIYASKRIYRPRCCEVKIILLIMTLLVGAPLLALTQYSELPQVNVKLKETKSLFHQTESFPRFSSKLNSSGYHPDDEQEEMKRNNSTKDGAEKSQNRPETDSKATKVDNRPQHGFDSKTNDKKRENVFREDYKESRQVNTKLLRNKKQDDKKNVKTAKYSEDEMKKVDKNDEETLQGMKGQSQNETDHDTKTQTKMITEMFTKYENIYKENSADCAGLFKLDLIRIKEGNRKVDNTRKQVLTDKYYTKLSKNCDRFKRQRGYITSVLSKEEEEFPIAYSILAYKDIEMVERLLRQIYRPQNYYCIHIDLKADEGVFKAASAIAKCFPNVVMASKRVDIRMGTFSALEPDLVCMKDLYSRGHWKYFINLDGQEMPLKTNLELVKILTEYEGSNDVQGSLTSVVYIRWRKDEIGPPPMGVKPVRGSSHLVAKRDFVTFVLFNRSSAIILDWVKQTKYPEETFFTTLNLNTHLGIHRNYEGWHESTKSNSKPFLVQYQRKSSGGRNHEEEEEQNEEDNDDGDDDNDDDNGCDCDLSTGDLPFLNNRPELFANRFNLQKDSLVVGCLEERLFNNTRDGFLNTRQFKTDIYRGLGFVIRQVGKCTYRKCRRKLIN